MSKPVSRNQRELGWFNIGHTARERWESEDHTRGNDAENYLSQ